jgi:hypothetical protein
MSTYGSSEQTCVETGKIVCKHHLVEIVLPAAAETGENNKNSNSNPFHIMIFIQLIQPGFRQLFPEKLHPC